MPSLDSISEWVLANLYLVGAVTGAVLLLVLLILLLVGRRGRRLEEQAAGPGGWQEDGRLSDNEEADFFGETLPPASSMEPLTPFTHDEPFTDTSDEPPPTADPADDAADDAAEDAAEVAAQVAAQDAADGAYPSPAPSPASTPETLLPAYVPPARPLWDHTRDIVESLIQGQGDITIAELRRLDLVRPDKVLEVAAELDAKLQGRGNESQRARLAKIRQHVEMLMPPVADLGVVETEPATAAPSDEEGGVVESSAFEVEGTALEPERELASSEAWDDAVEQSDALGDSLDRQPGIAPLFVSTPDPVIGEAVTIEPAPEETAGPATWPLGEPVEEAAAAEGPAEEAAAERPEGEDVLGLDQSERVASLSSLTPKELGRLFSATDDKTAKLSIIDALETMPGAETMSVIQLILDDTDSEVQLRALDAAERLLTQQ